MLKSSSSDERETAIDDAKQAAIAACIARGAAAASTQIVECIASPLTYNSAVCVDSNSFFCDYFENA